MCLKGMATRSPLCGLLSASVSISVVLAHTEESNFRNGNEKIFPLCNLVTVWPHNAVHWEGGSVVSRAVSEQRRGNCHHCQECWGGYTGFKEIELVTSMATHPRSSLMSLKSSLTCVYLCRWPLSQTEMRGFLLTPRFPSCASPVFAVEILILLLFLFFFFLTLFLKSFLSYRTLNIWLC